MGEVWWDIKAALAGSSWDGEGAGSSWDGEGREGKGGGALGREGRGFGVGGREEMGEAE